MNITTQTEKKLLSVQSLSYEIPQKTWYGKKRGSIPILKNISFDVSKGEFIVLLGLNGAGKTTLFNCLQGVNPDYSGSICVLGNEAKDRNSSFGKHIGVQIQSSQFLNNLRVKEMLRFACGLHQIPFEKDRMIKLLTRLGSEKVYDRSFASLSGGQKQRIRLAMAMVCDPEILFLDEPCAGLDVPARIALWDAINTLHEEGCTIFLITHHLQEIEHYTDRTLILEQGRLTWDSPVHTLIEQSPYTQKVFFNYVPLHIKRAVLQEKLATYCTTPYQCVFSGAYVYIHTNDEKAVLDGLKAAFKEEFSSISPTLQRINLEDVFMYLCQEDAKKCIFHSVNATS